MDIAAQYIEEVDYKIITCFENGRKVNFINNKQRKMQRIHIDGCIIPKGSTACDYLVRHVLAEPNAEYFVELKGTDVKHAIEQLEASIKKLSKASSLIRYAIVVSTHSHPAIRTDIQLGKKRLMNKYGFSLIVKSMKYEHNLDKDL